MTDGYISDRDLKCSDCYIRNSCDLHPSTCNKRLSVFDEEGLKIHDAKVRAEVIDEVRNLITQKLQTECHFKYCDDSDDCCEVNALMWLDEQLKEQKNE